MPSRGFEEIEARVVKVGGDRSLRRDEALDLGRVLYRRLNVSGQPITSREAMRTLMVTRQQLGEIVDTYRGPEKARFEFYVGNVTGGAETEKIRIHGRRGSKGGGVTNLQLRHQIAALERRLDELIKLLDQDLGGDLVGRLGLNAVPHEESEEGLTR